jgi:hypothetical protein
MRRATPGDNQSHLSASHSAKRVGLLTLGHVGGQLTFLRGCSLYFAIKKSSFLALPPFVAGLSHLIQQL